MAPTPSLLPSNPADRKHAFVLAHKLCGEGGLGWYRRLWLMHLGLNGDGGFAEPVAQYLAKKYNYSEHAGAASRARVIEILNVFTERLAAQHANGSDYLFDCGMTAVDIYSAAFAGLLQPLPDEVCAMRSATRAVFSELDHETHEAARSLLAHRDLMYDRWLEPVLRL